MRDRIVEDPTLIFINKVFRKFLSEQAQKKRQPKGYLGEHHAISLGMRDL